MSVHQQTGLSKRRDAAVREYSAAVHSLSRQHGESLREALVRAHHAHVDMLRESGFPRGIEQEACAKSKLVIIKRF